MEVSMILNLDPKYLLPLEQQLSIAENALNEHRQAITLALLNAAAIREILPSCDKTKYRKAVEGHVVESSEYKDNADDLHRLNREVSHRKLAVDKLLPEYERLRELKDKADAEKAEAEAKKLEDTVEGETDGE
jgi:hypothetical protein